MYREKITLLRLSAQLFIIGYKIRLKEQRLSRRICRKSLTESSTLKLSLSLENEKQRFFTNEQRLIPALLRMYIKRRL